MPYFILVKTDLKQMGLLILALKKCSRCHHHLTPLFGATRPGHTYLPLTTKQNKIKRAEICSEWEPKKGTNCRQLHSSCNWSLPSTRVWCHALCTIVWGYCDVPQALSGTVLKARQGIFNEVQVRAVTLPPPRFTAGMVLRRWWANL